MKTNTKLLIATALFGFSSLLFTGCKKDDDEKFDADFQTATDNSIGEATYNDVHSMADQAEGSGKLNTYKLGSTEDGSLLNSCVDTIIRDTINKKITIDFGTDACTSADGRMRRGKILISYTGRYRDPGSVKTITFDNYYVNDHKVEGTKTVTNNGKNSAGHLTFNVHVDGKIILANNGGTITHLSDRVREWTEGESTLLDWRDDVYSITGSGSGTNAKGVPYTATIVNPLIKKLAVGCKYLVSGVLDITPSQKPTRRIDYGDGTCDNKATVTVNGHIFNVTLGH